MIVAKVVAVVSLDEYQFKRSRRAHKRTFKEN
jgi:hypothetical protein